MEAKDELGEIIYQARLNQSLTQDQFGAKYDVSGPAVFKFEKGYVRPSLRLWLRIAQDAEILERRAVLMWLRAKLPEKYRPYVSLAPSSTPVVKKGVTDYSSFEDSGKMRLAALADKTLPKPLRDLLSDDELWALFRPTGHEINMLRDLISPIGKKGTTKSYGDALRLIREFSHSF